MIEILADNIISPLGTTTDANYRAVIDNRSELRVRECSFGLPEAFCGSLLDRDRIGAQAAQEGISSDLTFFERLCILSATDAITRAGIDASADDVVFILSSTKGNVELLQDNPLDSRCYLAYSAGAIASHFRNPNTPITASNACISGICAQIAGVRALLTGRYRTAIVIGADVLSRFIISGFQSFKALSAEPCMPYDKNRTGLNLGEAAGTIILHRTDTPGGRWHYVASSIHNDANHISGPSRTGEGAYRVLTDMLCKVPAESIAFINAHGTATAYNDEMESIAIHRAGLDHKPVMGLKGYYGHTLGAAGVIETILSMRALDDGTIISTRGYSECGTSHPLNISSGHRAATGSTFIKILSGFGGSNAGIAYTKGGDR